MKNYVIPAGRHASRIWRWVPYFALTYQKEIRFRGRFLPDCLYQISSLEGADFNKFFGVATSYFNHQSARLGWRCVDGKQIELCVFCRDEGILLPTVKLGSISPLEIFECTIKIERNHFTFIYEQGNHHKVVMVRKKQKSWRLKPLLFPYFGGLLTAPHRMTMQIERL